MTMTNKINLYETFIKYTFNEYLNSQDLLDLFVCYECSINILSAYLLSESDNTSSDVYLNLYGVDKPTFGAIFVRFKDIYFGEKGEDKLFDYNAKTILAREYIAFTQKLKKYDFYNEISIGSNSALPDLIKIILYLRNLYVHERVKSIQSLKEDMERLLVHIIESTKWIMIKNLNTIYILRNNNNLLYLNSIKHVASYKDNTNKSIELNSNTCIHIKGKEQNKIESELICYMPFIKVNSGLLSFKGYDSNRYDDYYVDEFYISKYPISNKLFNLFLLDNVEYLSKRLKNSTFLQDYRNDSIQNKLRYEEHACYYIDWLDTTQFCNWLSKSNQLQSVYQKEQSDISKKGFRLPTEIEWYYAATCGLGDKATIPLNQIIYRDNRGKTGKTVPNSQLYENTWGIAGMLGNINEWTNSDSVKVRIKKFEEVGKINNRKIIKGGSFASPKHLINYHYSTDVNIDNEHYIGFRIVLTK